MLKLVKTQDCKILEGLLCDNPCPVPECVCVCVTCHVPETRQRYNSLNISSQSNAYLSQELNRLEHQTGNSRPKVLGNQ